MIQHARRLFLALGLAATTAFTAAAKPEKAVPIYETFVERLRALGITVATGEFGADMKVRLLNDGPVTIWLDSRS